MHALKPKAQSLKPNPAPKPTAQGLRADLESSVQRPAPTAFGLYLHIPFCSAICNYCNFNRVLLDADLKSRFVAALIADIASDGPVPSGPLPDRVKVDSIYFGGGTPSLLTPAEVAAILGACHQRFEVAADVEVTLEANPESVSVDSLAGYRHAGVNRVSFGVQSFREAELRRLSRLHSVDRARDAYREARTAGFDNVSLDLMMWLPAQQVADWLESVESAAALAPDHLSLYMLEVYPNAPLKDEMARAAWSQAPDDDVATMYEEAMGRLEEKGYAQYEISNVAREGRRSRHNLKYWTDGQWIGFGPGAHSTVDGVRWKTVSATDEYVARVAAGANTATDIRRLSPGERLEEALFTGLRLNDGIDVPSVNTRYGVDLWARYGAALECFVEARLLEVDGKCWRLTRRGMLLAHEVMTVFV